MMFMVFVPIHRNQFVLVCVGNIHMCLKFFPNPYNWKLRMFVCLNGPLFWIHYGSCHLPKRTHKVSSAGKGGMVGKKLLQRATKVDICKNMQNITHKEMAVVPF